MDIQDNTKKTKECLSCEKLFRCKGKPEEIERCLHYVERKKDDKEV